MISLTGGTGSPFAILRLALIAIAGLLAACAEIEPNKVAALDEQQQSRFEQHMRMARAAQDGGDARTAAIFYHNAAQTSPYAAEPLIELGALAADAGPPDAAAKYYRQALDIDPNSVDARIGYANALLAMRRPKLALENFQRAAAVDGDDFRTHNGLGISHDLLGEHEQAQEAYRAGLRHAAGNPTLRNNLALSMLLAGHADQAIPILEELTRSPLGNARFRHNLALAHALRGDMTAAENLLRGDLDNQEIAANLAFYRLARRLPSDQLARAILFGHMDGEQVAMAETANAPANGAGERRAAAPTAAQADFTPASGDDAEAGMTASRQQHPAIGPTARVRPLPTSASPGNDAAPGGKTDRQVKTDIAAARPIPHRDAGNRLTGSSNLRAAPNPQAQILTRLSKGTAVSLISEDPTAGYYPVTTGSRRGWIWWLNVDTKAGMAARAERERERATAVAAAAPAQEEPSAEFASSDAEAPTASEEAENIAEAADGGTPDAEPASVAATNAPTAAPVASAASPDSVAETETAVGGEPVTEATAPVAQPMEPMASEAVVTPVAAAEPAPPPPAKANPVPAETAIETSAGGSRAAADEVAPGGE